MVQAHLEPNNVTINYLADLILCQSSWYNPIQIADRSEDNRSSDLNLRTTCALYQAVKPCSFQIGRERPLAYHPVQASI